MAPKGKAKAKAKATIKLSKVDDLTEEERKAGVDAVDALSPAELRSKMGSMVHFFKSNPDKVAERSSPY